MNSVLADSSYSTCSARGQPSSGWGDFLKRRARQAGRQMSNVPALRAHKHVACLDLVSLY